MTAMELLETIGSIKDKYVLEAYCNNASSQRRISIRRTLLIAAVITLALLLVGCAAVYVFSLQNMKIGSYSNTIPTCEADSSGSIVSSDMISLQGYAGTPNYKAALEWQKFLEDYDQDGELLKKADTDDFQVPMEYMSYNCYTQEMKDKIDALCLKYGLELLGQTYFPDNVYQMFMNLGIDTIVAEYTVAQFNLYSGYYYQNGTFSFEGDVVLPCENNLWPYDINFQYRCVMKTAFDTVSLSIGNIEDYDQWNYTLADGTVALLAISSEKALMIVDKEDYFVTINILNPYFSDIQHGEVHMDRTAVEAFADSFGFAYTPHNLGPGIQKRADMP